MLLLTHAVWNVSAFGAILVRIFPYSDWILENADQNNSKYGAFLRTENKKQVTTNIYTVLYCPGLLFLISRGIIGRKV